MGERKPPQQAEMVIGLVAPLGADLDAVTDALAKGLQAYDYNTHTIRLSSLIKSVRGLASSIVEDTEDKRIETLMRAGTELRRVTDRGDILALMTLPKISQIREEEVDVGEGEKFRGNAFILRSFKNRSEIDTLRDVYGSGVFVVSIYMSKSRRNNGLSKLIAQSNNSTDSQKYAHISSRLIEVDEEEEGSGKLGQDVGGAFPLADYFVDVSDRGAVEKQIERFLRIIFSHPFQTPRKDEFGLFQARGAALRSADLSRQVGAAIANSDGDVVALGCNDVPKTGGGQYWADDERDGRDFILGYDSSAHYKIHMLSETISRLIKNGLVSEDYSSVNPFDLANRLISGDLSRVMDGTQITHVLEYGRIVHAEMAAITDAESEVYR